MGLSICYEWQWSGTPTAARDLITQLQTEVRTYELADVSEVVEIDLQDPAADDEDRHFAGLMGSQYGQKRMRDGTDVWIDIPPRSLVLFIVHPAEGSETAAFGLATHPPVIEYVYQGETLFIETGLSGRWSWTQFCKTQYAGLPQHGGVDNFLAAHLGVVRILDRSRELGLNPQVKDDSDYWEDRDLPKLRKTLSQWNGLIAAFAGKMKDQFDDAPAGTIQAPILTAPNFEHLEADGLKEWSTGENDEDGSPNP
jgi:hypothetical protein